MKRHDTKTFLKKSEMLKKKQLARFCNKKIYEHRKKENKNRRQKEKTEKQTENRIKRQNKR